MKRLSFYVTAMALSLLAMPAIGQQWKANVSTDAMTDQERRIAYITNDDGHSFAVSRTPTGAVLGMFELSDRSLDQLSHRRLPEFRIDRGKVYDINIHSRMLRPSLEPQWKPKFVTFHILSDAEPAGREMLSDLANGKRMVLRYYLFTGGATDTAFTLNGARAAILSTLGMATMDGPLPRARAALSRQAEAEKACVAEPEPDDCRQKIVDCSNWYASNPNAFRQCIQVPTAAHRKQ